MTRIAIDLKTVILKFIEAMEEQSSEARLAELQKTMFLFQRCSKNDFVRFSIFNYGPYSFDLERELDALLVDRSIERLGSKFLVTVSPPSSPYDETIKSITALLKTTSPTDMQKACTVMYFKDRSEDDSSAFEKAHTVSPKSEVNDFRSAYGAVSNMLSQMTFC